MFECFIAVASAFIGFFISVRLNSFIFQWQGLAYSSWVHMLIAVLFFVAALIFRKRATAFLTENAYGSKPCARITYVISIIISYALRSPLIYDAIEGTAVNSFVVLVACLLGCGLLLGLFILITVRAFQLIVIPAIKSIRRFKKQDWLFLCILLLVLNAATWLYVHASRTIYYWDNAGYWETTHSLADIFRESPIKLLKEVYNSIMTSDYNYIIALPGTILCALFGKSRYVFLAGIINIYVFPLFLAVFLYVRHRWNRYILTTTGILLFFPCAFYLSLIGFVDIAGVIPCFLAVLFYFRGSKSNPLNYFVTGTLLALAVLLRRWYVFFALSFVIISIVDSIAFTRSAKSTLATLLPFGFILLFFFQKFVSYRLLADYGSMYAAYQLGLKSDCMIFFRYFGVIPVMCLLGFAVYQITKKENRRQSILMLIQPIICFSLFVSIQTHGQQHLLLYLPALYCLASSAFGIALSLEKKLLVTAGAAVPLVLSAYCLLPTKQPSSIQEIENPAIIANFSFKPAVRDDIDDLLEITKYTDSLVVGTDKQMAVLASSLKINREILTNLELSLSLKNSDEIDRSYMLSLPSVDSRDSLPLNIEAWDYVLVASPVQTHLGEENQNVVTIPAYSFLSGSNIAAAYKQLPEHFILSGTNIEVFIFEKLRDATEDEYNEYISHLREALPDKFEN